MLERIKTFITGVRYPAKRKKHFEGFTREEAKTLISSVLCRVPGNVEYFEKTFFNAVIYGIKVFCTWK